jgi:hypothetical protein
MCCLRVQNISFSSHFSPFPFFLLTQTVVFCRTFLERTF